MTETITNEYTIFFIINSILYYFHTRPKGEKIARAKNSEGAAGGGAAPEHSEAEGRANTLKFDIFCKRPDVKFFKQVEENYE
jgi:hypothetical protein